MHTAELHFRTRKRLNEDAASAIDDLLWALERNGQLIPDMSRLRAQGRDGLRCIVSLPEANSLRVVQPNRHVKDARAALRKCGLAAPTARVLGHDLESDPVCRCRRWSALVMSTDFLTAELPIRCGDCAGVVPFYRFRHTSEYATYEDIIFWMYHFRAFDSIWVYSGAGEQLGYRQVSKHDSELSREGRDVCKAIEQRTRVPVYYELFRYYGRSLVTERKRRCPSCGGPWLLREPWLRYDFRCRRCRLVSYFACDVTT